jgi:signal transduction histidine kinase/ActR/RegA family two-component response regulator
MWLHGAQMSRSNAKRSQLFAAETRLLYTNANVAVGVTLVAATILAWLHWQVVSHHVVVAWWAYMMMLSAVRGIVAHRYWLSPYNAESAGNAVRWANVFAVLAGCAGAGWGAAGIVLYAPAHLTNQVFLVFVLGGMMLGAVSVLAPRPEAFLAFLIPSGLVPAARLLYAGDDTHVAMGLLAAVFTIATIRTTGSIHHTIASSLELQFENQDLVGELQAANYRAEALNQQLELRVEERTAALQETNERLGAEIQRREQTEEELLRARKLESLGVLAGGIAHDFNNFLTIVLGNIEILKLQLESAEPVDELLHQIDTACKRATFLSSQLLTFAKGGSPVRRLMPVSNLIMDVVRLARAGASVSFDVFIAEDLRSAEVDSSQMSQALYNILLNARQAMPEGGIIEVRAENSPEQGLHTAPTVRISVRDYGCGISADILPRIFDPYFTTKPSGSGLGLATAYAIVTKHGGRIDVESAPGQGTIFTVDLPAALQCAEPEPTCIAAPQQQPAGRVLVMDDEEAIRRLLKMALTALGYDVQTAGEGAEAVASYEAAKDSGRRFDVMLLDLTVNSGMGGLEAAARIREVDPDARLIVSSGYSNSAVMAEYRRYGFDGVLPKPWSATELSEVFRRVLVADSNREPR